MSGVTVKPLSAPELSEAPPLLAPEGWTFTLTELERLHRLGGAMGARDASGRLVGFLSFVDFPPVRWIGNVVVHAAARGQQVAARMVDATIAGAATAGLYAVPRAVTLYERAGFRAAGDAVALRATDARPVAPAPNVTPLDATALKEAAALDMRASGMDRAALLAELLRAYPDTAVASWDGAGRLRGYGIAKPAPDLTEVGPVVATDAEAASDILDALLSRTEGPHETALLAADAGPLARAVKRGFRETFRPTVMFRGAPPAWRPDALQSAAGLEKG